MSYYLFKRKQFIRVGDKLFPLVKYADSSARSIYGTRDYHWSLYNITDLDRLLIPINYWEEARRERIRDVIYWTKRYSKNTDIPDEELYGFCGDRYPSGMKIKNEKSFLSSRRLVKFQDFLKNNFGGFVIKFVTYDRMTHDTKDSEYHKISSEKDLVNADEAYQTYCKKMPAGCGITIGIEGVNI